MTAIRLGHRLRKGNITEADLRLLDQYRRSFSAAYGFVVETIRKELGLEPTGRPARSTTSISDKPRRESIRLSQVQDIAGRRLIVADIPEQESVVRGLTGLFEQATVSDRRARPSHGYRAVHVIVNSRGKQIEIQVRTALQHLWSEISEKWSDIIDPSIKYGGGNEELQTELRAISTLFATEETLGTRVVDGQKDLQAELRSIRQDMFDDFRDILARMEKFKGEGDDISG